MPYLSLQLLSHSTSVNIATFHVGREAPGANEIALIEFDGELPEAILAKVRALPQVQQARPLHF